MQYGISEIASAIGSTMDHVVDSTATIKHLSTDTRSIVKGKHYLFFAIKGPNRSGSAFLTDAIKKGVKNVVLEKEVYLNLQNRFSINILLVKDCKKALQDLSSYHRTKSKITAIAISGSNGKTIIKDWLYQLLGRQKSTVKSPKSYNSQIGVPLSVSLIEKHHEYGVFEAGISLPGEMHRLEQIIQPQIGIMANLGDAHDEGFISRDQKLAEKILLYKNCQQVVYCADHLEVARKVEKKIPPIKGLSWSQKNNPALYQVKVKGPNSLLVRGEGLNQIFVHPIKQAALVENLIHVLVTCHALGLDMDQVSKDISKSIYQISMRLEVENGIDNSLLINDTYNADLSSLKIALDTQQTMADGRSKTVILSDILEQGLDEKHLKTSIEKLLADYQVGRFISIGKQFGELSFEGEHEHFDSTSFLLSKLGKMSFEQEIILLKGARSFHLDKVFNRLTKKSHSTTLHIDLAAVGSNLMVYQSMLKPGVKAMVIIKASAYGTGSVDIARFLVQRGIEHLAVAFPDEGILLRQNHINASILVLNPDMQRMEDYVQHNLEIEVYALEQLRRVKSYLSEHPNQSIKVHLKLDTGMHRLGFYKEDLKEVSQVLSELSNIELVSLFSHLSGSENPAEDSFTKNQFDQFDDMCSLLPKAKFKHILNTAGIVRFPEKQYEMVRLGLGLYGIDSSEEIEDHLIKAHRLTASIIQIKSLQKGGKVGYNQQYTADRDCHIAILNIGYADGLFRNSGNGQYSFLYKEHKIPIIGNVCMDLTICLLPEGILAKEGDEVVIFGPEHPIEQLASINNTIPYEILSRIAPRVKRKYILE